MVSSLFLLIIIVKENPYISWENEKVYKKPDKKKSIKNNRYSSLRRPSRLKNIDYRSLANKSYTYSKSPNKSTDEISTSKKSVNRKNGKGEAKTPKTFDSFLDFWLADYEKEHPLMNFYSLYFLQFFHLLIETQGLWAGIRVYKDIPIKIIQGILNMGNLRLLHQISILVVIILK